MNALYRFFLLQAAIFLPYHRNRRNWLLHQIGLPMSVFGFMVALAWVEFFDVGGYTVSLATVVVIPAMVFWLFFDFAIGLVTTLFYAVLLVLADLAAGLPFAGSAAIVAGFFVGGMVFQYIGHELEDGKLAAAGLLSAPTSFLMLVRTTFGTPTILHNHIQLFVVPMVLIATIAFRLGYKLDLKAEMERHPKVGNLER